VGIVDEPVENGVGQSRIADGLVPMIADGLVPMIADGLVPMIDWRSAGDDG